MGTKGPSYRYGNTRGTDGRGKVSEHINFQYAKDYNKNRLNNDFERHAKDFGISNIKDYAHSAVHFSNVIDRVNNISFIDKKGTTHKYNQKKNIYAAIDKKGYVVTYFKPREGLKYYYRKKGEKIR